MLQLKFTLRSLVKQSPDVLPYYLLTCVYSRAADRTMAAPTPAVPPVPPVGASSRSKAGASRGATGVSSNSRVSSNRGTMGDSSNNRGDTRYSSGSSWLVHRKLTQFCHKKSANKLLSLPVCGKFRKPFMTFTNNIHPDEAPQNVGPHLRSKSYDTQIIYQLIVSPAVSRGDT